MLIEIDLAERELLQRLVDHRYEELGPEIHRCRVNRFRDVLKHEQKTVERLREKLHESAWDVTA